MKETLNTTWNLLNVIIQGEFMSSAPWILSLKKETSLQLQGIINVRR